MGKHTYSSEEALYRAKPAVYGNIVELHTSDGGSRITIVCFLIVPSVPYEQPTVLHEVRIYHLKIMAHAFYSQHGCLLPMHVLPSFVIRLPNACLCVSPAFPRNLETRDQSKVSTGRSISSIYGTRHRGIPDIPRCRGKTFVEPLCGVRDLPPYLSAGLPNKVYQILDPMIDAHQRYVRKAHIQYLFQHLTCCKKNGLFRSKGRVFYARVRRICDYRLELFRTRNSCFRESAIRENFGMDHVRMR